MSDDQLNLLDAHGAARATDPHTSREAAAVVRGDSTKLRASQARVLAMFRLYGDMHDKQLKEYLHSAEKGAGIKPLMSDSGIRSRRSELSKPNMDRLDQIVAEERRVHPQRSEDVTLANARLQLRREGFRSPLWDTGKRAVVDGRRVTVWGIAR